MILPADKNKPKIIRLIIWSAKAASALWFLVFFIGGLIATGGQIHLAGGGASVIALLPSLVFFCSLFYFHKKSEPIALQLSLVFWSMILAILIAWFSWGRYEAHWPVALALIYMVAGIISLFASLFFSIQYIIKIRKSDTQ